MRIVKLLVLALTVSMLMGCQDKADHSITYDANGTTLQVEKGDIVKVTLDAMLGAGLSWQVAEPVTGISLEKQDQQKKKVDGKEVGGEEEQLFFFKVTESGTLSMKYSHPYGETKEPENSFTVDFSIKE